MIAENVKSTVEDIIGNFDNDTEREELIESIDEYCDSLWGELVKPGHVELYDCDDLAETAMICAEIIQYAKENAWVEDDWGLWEGVQYGVLASMAYFSLRNVLYQALCDEGVDSNDDMPFENYCF